MQFSLVLGISLLALLSVSGINGELKWENLRVTFGLNPLSKYTFAQMPKTLSEAVSKKWHQVKTDPKDDCTNGGKFNGFRYISGSDVGLALLFNKNEKVVGIQMNLAKSQIITPSNKYKFDKVSMFRSDSIEGTDVYSLTAYFVNPATICTQGESLSESKIEEIGNQLYLQNGTNPSQLIVPPKNRTEAIKEGWTKNNCFYGMGYHNFYKSEEFEKTDCTEIRPVFLLFNKDGDMQGFGFVGVGNATSPRFEHPPASALEKIIGDHTPKCLPDIANTVQFSTMHVYFIDKPQFILCL